MKKAIKTAPLAQQVASQRAKAMPCVEKSVSRGCYDDGVDVCPLDDGEQASASDLHPGAGIGGDAGQVTVSGWATAHRAHDVLNLFRRRLHRLCANVWYRASVNRVRGDAYVSCPFCASLTSSFSFYRPCVRRDCRSRCCSPAWHDQRNRTQE